MAVIEQRLAATGLELPEPPKVREGLRMPFTWVRVRDNRAYISGRVACNPDGTLAKRLGKVGAAVSLRRLRFSPPRRAGASRQPQARRRRPGPDHRLAACLRDGERRTGFNETPLVTNGYSDPILELKGPDAGAHARSSIAMAIPLDAPVNCEAEVEIDG